IVEKEDVKGPRDLIATKKGVIKKMYVSKGKPQVQLHDYVEPGDLLVSGNLTGSLDEDEEESEKDPIYVVSEGEVIANTWYEVSVTITLKTNYESMTGNQNKKDYLKLNDYQIPIWGFRSADYQHKSVENKVNSIRFLKWKLPINIVESTISEKEHITKMRNKEEAVKIGIEQAKKELKLQLGTNATIISEKLLHESNENGKVRLKLYVSVEEDIVKEQPINTKEKKEKNNNE